MDRVKCYSIGKRLINGVPYLVILCMAISLKIYYSRAGSDDLRWILSPIAQVIDVFSDLTFEYEPTTGFIDRTRRIIIAPECAGVNFMIVALCMTGFSVLPLSRSGSGKLAWLGFSMVAAYLLMIAANTLRIAVAIDLYQADIYGRWMTPERVHRFAGILIYLFLLCGFFRLISRLKQRLPRGWRCHLKRKPRDDALIPLMCYVAVTIGVPLLNEAYLKGAKRFMEHCGMILFGCLIAFLSIYLLNLAYRRFFLIKTYLCDDGTASNRGDAGMGYGKLTEEHNR